MDEAHELIEATIRAHVAREARVVDIRRRAGGAQGFSGAALRYYDVTFEAGARGRGEVGLVIKEAPLAERRTLAWLNGRGLAVPFSHTLDLATDAPAPVCMQFAGDAAPPPEMVDEVARGLAAIHAAAMGRGVELAWLPGADRAYFMGQWLSLPGASPGSTRCTTRHSQAMGATRGRAARPAPTSRPSSAC